MAMVYGKDLSNVYRVPNITLNTADPAVTNDGAHGYSVGDQWINTATPSTWVLVNSATGAAVWSEVTQPFQRSSYATGLAAVGTTRAGALALTAQTNDVTTVAASTAGVVLPSAASVGIGGTVRVINTGANPMHVYSAGSDTIDASPGATGVVLTNAFYCDYEVNTAGAFVSYKSPTITRSS